MHRWIKTRAALLALLAVLTAGQTAESQQREERREAMSRRGWLGIAYTTPADGQGRIVVEQVLPGSPAARAGLAAADTLVRWNGRTDVVAALTQSRLQPGDTLRLRVRRGPARDRDVALVVGERPRRALGLRGPERDRSIVLPRRPLAFGFRVEGDSVRVLHLDSLAMHADSLHRRLRVMLRDSLGPRLQVLEREMEREMPRIRAEARRAAEEARRAAGEVRSITIAPLGVHVEAGLRGVAGAELTELNPGLSDYFGVGSGVLVLRVAPGTPAARAGLEAGDVVVRAAGDAVGSIRDLREAVRGADRRELALEVIRKGARRQLQMRWE